jgi:hypothetical protein
MDESLLSELVKRAHLPSPGDSSFLSSPDRSRAIEAAVIHHHRFAFFYWVRWTTNDFACSLPTDLLAPDLVTVDWHDDVGCEEDCVFDELRHLVERLEVDDVNDQNSLEDAVHRRRTSENNVAAYSFLGLRSLNDGHIFPAQYLNAIRNVYVLYKQRGKQSHRMTDQFGNEHETHYVNKPEDLMQKLNLSGSHPVYFDLDVDYFFRQGRGQIHGAEVMVPEEEIRRLLDLKGGMMTQIMASPLLGMTIALEPTYCGGLKGCTRALSVICETLFDGSLLGDKVDWRKRRSSNRRETPVNRSKSMD